MFLLFNSVSLWLAFIRFISVLSSIFLYSLLFLFVVFFVLFYFGSIDIFSTFFFLSFLIIHSSLSSFSSLSRDFLYQDPACLWFPYFSAFFAFTLSSSFLTSVAFLSTIWPSPTLSPLPSLPLSLPSRFFLGSALTYSLSLSKFEEIVEVLKRDPSLPPRPQVKAKFRLEIVSVKKNFRRLSFKNNSDVFSFFSGTKITRIMFLRFSRPFWELPLPIWNRNCGRVFREPDTQLKNRDSCFPQVIVNEVILNFERFESELKNSSRRSRLNEGLRWFRSYSVTEKLEKLVDKKFLPRLFASETEARVLTFELLLLLPRNIRNIPTTISLRRRRK